jgi:2-iminobutanoate/2-iminopropanoate deaminase
MKAFFGFSLYIVTAAFSLAGGAALAQQSSGPKQVISTPNAPEAIGPYSQAIKAGNIVFLAGQIPIDPKTKQLMKDASIEDQTKLVLENLKAVLEADGMTMDNIVFTQVFMINLDEFPRMNDIYATFFKSAPPARAIVQVPRLPRDVKVEIAAIAVR